MSGLSPRRGGPSEKPEAPRRRPSAASRAVPMLVTFLGVVLIIVTQAVERGILTGVPVDRTAYVFGGVLVVLGIVGLGRGDDDAAEEPAETGPIRESGRDPNEADELARLQETLRSIEQERRGRSGLGSDR